MRNYAALLSLVLILAACGGSEAKAAFERYESAVDPLLGKEEDLRKVFEDRLQDLSAYGKKAEVDGLIRKRLIPFYEEMAADVAAIVPEDAALASIHADLVHYVGLRNELFKVYVDLDAMAKKTQQNEEPANKKVEDAQRGFSDKVKAIQTVLQDKPDLVAKVLPLFKEMDVVAGRIFGGMEQLRQGAIRAADLLKFIDDHTATFFDRMGREIDALELSKGEESFRPAAKDYVGAFRVVVGAVREFCLVRQAQEEGLVPLEERFGKLQEEVGTALTVYRTGAKEYRASLR